jgi:hypothetical protein
VKKNNFEIEIRNKLNQFQAADNSNAWEEFISYKKPRPWGKTQWLITGISTIIVGVVLVLSLHNKDLTNLNNKTSNNTAHNQNNKLSTQTTNSNTPNNSNENIQNKITSQDKNKNKPIDNNEITTIPAETSMQETYSKTNNDETLITEESQSTIPKDSADIQETSQMPVLSNLDFGYNILNNCTPGLVYFYLNNCPKGYFVEWDLGDNNKSNISSFEHLYTSSGEYKPILHIYNETKKEIKTIIIGDISIKNTPVANISFVENNKIYTFNSFSDNANSVIWEIDEQQYYQRSLDYEFHTDGKHKVKLIVENEFGCTAEANKTLQIDIKHNYFVPTAFRPLSGGINSSFGPIGDELENFTFRMLIYDKTGSLVFETDLIDYLWNGKINNVGQLADPGVYRWEIITIDQFGNMKIRKGQVNLIGN